MMFIEAFCEHARRDPHKPAATDPFRSLSFARMATFPRVIRRLALAHTASPRVGVMLPASAGGMGTVLGVLWAGRTVVPLNFLLAPAELDGVIRDAGLDLILSVKYFEKTLANAPARVLYLEDAGLKWRFLLEKLRPGPRPPAVAAQDTAAIIYTSGSTGRPKGVCLSHHNLLSNCRAAIQHFQLEPGHHMLGMIPPFHVFGLTVTVLLPALHGMSVTYLPRFSPQAMHKIVAEGRVSMLLAVPSMYAAMARLKDIQPADFAGVRLAVCGGEPLPAKVFDEVRRRTGLSLLEGYGMTETAPVISANTPEASQPGSVGRCIPGVEISIRDEFGRPLPTGQEGELYVRGPGVMQGYFNQPDETRAVLDPDGWLRTGDIVTCDAHGFIRITGRAKDLIIVGGENVYPREVEGVLEQHPAVAEAAVVGRQDASRGEVVVGFVVLNSSAQTSPDELRTFCRDRLAGFKVPRDIVVVPDLPRGPTGKILKRQLRETCNAAG